MSEPLTEGLVGAGVLVAAGGAVATNIQRAAGLRRQLRIIVRDGGAIVRDGRAIVCDGRAPA